MRNITRKELVKEFFVNNANRQIKTEEIIEWVTAEYTRRTGKIFRDPDRAIRKLHQQEFLIKIQKGTYMYDPVVAHTRKLEDFSELQKEQAKQRDGNKCVVCGLGPEHGAELYVEHIKPKDKGGKATLDNAQTLCFRHNFIKKNLNQTETVKKMFISLYEKAKAEGNVQYIEFCEAILQVYDDFDVNGHIEWKK